MDKITQQTLKALEKLEQDLHRCQMRLECLGRAKVPVYFGVPYRAQGGFLCLYGVLAEMKQQLEGPPASPAVK